MTTPQANTVTDLMNEFDALGITEATIAAEWKAAQEKLMAEWTAKFDPVRARRQEVYGSLEAYRSELDGSKLTTEQVQDKIDEIQIGLMDKFGPMAVIVEKLFEGFKFGQSEKFDLDHSTAVRLCDLLEIGNGAESAPDYMPMIEALTVHVAGVASSSGLTNYIMPAYQEVLCSLNLKKAARVAVSALSSVPHHVKRETVARTSFILPGYPDQTGYDGANASVIVKANGTKAVSFGGQTVQRYLDRVNHPEPETAKQQLLEMANVWARDNNLLN